MTLVFTLVLWVIWHFRVLKMATFRTCDWGWSAVCINLKYRPIFERFVALQHGDKFHKNIGQIPDSAFKYVPYLIQMTKFLFLMSKQYCTVLSLYDSSERERPKNNQQISHHQCCWRSAIERPSWFEGGRYFRYNHSQRNSRSEERSLLQTRPLRIYGGHPQEHMWEHWSLQRVETKDTLVDKIFFRKSKTEYSDNEVIALNMLRESQSDDSNQLQQIYKEHFNLEDKFNECLLEFLPKFTVTNWSTNLLIGVILSQIVNARAFLEEKQKGKKN